MSTYLWGTVLRKALFAKGLRYRIHVTNLPGKPDLVFPGKRAAIYIHGCFWHSHACCYRFKIPSSNQEYWIPKLTRNSEKDKKNLIDLRQSGWRVLIVWECALVGKQKYPIDKVAEKVIDWLYSDDTLGEITGKCS